MNISFIATKRIDYIIIIVNKVDVILFINTV